MAEPKKKTSKSRKNIRRKDKKQTVAMAKKCPKCGKNTMPHTICAGCGTYVK